MALIGCNAAAEGPSDDEKAHVQSQMAAHYADAVTMRDAVVAGDLAAAQKAAGALKIRLPMQDLPAGTATPERAFVEQLLKVEAARDTTQLGEAVGVLVGRCAACHVAAGATPVVAESPPPSPGDGSIPAAMALHRYGAEQMWAGLLIPDPARVVRGAEALSTAVLAPTGTAVGSAVPPLASELEVQVHDLAAHAARTEDAAGRASAFGRMLGTCAACHAVTHGGPQGSGAKETSSH